MAHKAAVVIPVYKETLNEFEKISLTQVQKVLGQYQYIFVAPQGKNIPYVTQGSEVYFFPPQFFQNTKTYNYLMMSPNFYKAFLDYEYILIYQLDAFVFSDELEYFCGLGYDYIGAVWSSAMGKTQIIYQNKFYRVYVGNGGFSLRKVETFYKFLLNHKDFCAGLQTLPEDFFFGLSGVLFKDEFSVAPLKIAYKFSVEHCIERFVKKNGGKLPFGCHAWQFLSADFAMKNFVQFGYDLKPLRGKMYNASANELRYNLLNMAIKRLNRRVQKNQSIARYLPKKNFASIIVLRNPFALMILTRLMLENSKISNEIILYDEKDTDILIQNLKLDQTSHLLITAGGNIDDALINELSKCGVTYGNRVVSFYREYIMYCWNLFKNLGK